MVYRRNYRGYRRGRRRYYGRKKPATRGSIYGCLDRDWETKNLNLNI